jgi:hypothetical protein
MDWSQQWRLLGLKAAATSSQCSYECAGGISAKLAELWPIAKSPVIVWPANFASLK